ncbi:MAG: hypothetical protein M3P51_13155 [Chloroflexota bacterium]|nr:hypothetical protein [Chloroflexota bacterium]
MGSGPIRFNKVMPEQTEKEAAAQQLARAVFAMRDCGASKKEIERCVSLVLKTEGLLRAAFKGLDQTNADVMAGRAFVDKESGEIIYNS